MHYLCAIGDIKEKKLLRGDLNMPYRTRSYIGLPFIPHPLRTYEVDQGTARVIHLFQARSSAFRSPAPQ